MDVAELGELQEYLEALLTVQGSLFPSCQGIARTVA